MNYPQMRFKYIKYKNICIRDNLSAVNFFYDHFFIPARIRKIHYFILKIIIIFVYLSRLYRLRYDTISLIEDFIVKKEGQGSFGSDVVIARKNNGDYVVKKRIFSDEAFNSYKKYYDKYCRNQSKIILPKSVFDEKNKTITIDFIPMLGLVAAMRKGDLDFEDAAAICQKISKEIDIMYGSETLIHGDFSVVNIFLYNGEYYLIDYADAFEYKKEYDKYFLFKSLLKYAGLDRENYNLLNKYFNLSPREFEEYERVYKERRRLKMGAD